MSQLQQLITHLKQDLAVVEQHEIYLPENTHCVQIVDGKITALSLRDSPLEAMPSIIFHLESLQILFKYTTRLWTRTIYSIRLYDNYI